MTSELTSERAADPGKRSPRRALRRPPRRYILLLQLAIVGLIVWLLVVPQIRKSKASLSLIFDVDSSWLLVAVAAELLSLAAYAMTTRAMLPRRERPSLQRVLRIDLSSIALSHCVPDGGAAGTALCWRLLVAAGVPSAEAMVAKLAQGLLAAVVLQAMLVVAFAAGMATADLGRWNTLPAAMSLAIVLVAAALVLVLRRRGVRRALANALARLPRYGPRAARAAGRIYRRHAVRQFQATFAERHHMAAPVVFAAANWGLDALALWASIATFGDRVGLEGLATAFAIQSFAAWLPVSPSGLGISEGLMIPALIAFGASSSSAVLGVLTWRVLAFWLPMPIGAVAYGSLCLGARSEPPPSDDRVGILGSNQ